MLGGSYVCTFCTFIHSFGVCCLFTVTDTSAQITQNCTYIQNPGFPMAYTETANIQYNVQKCANGTHIEKGTLSNIKMSRLFDVKSNEFSDVCFLRLDFEMMTIIGVGATVDAVAAVASACTDTFVVTVVPRLELN